MSSAPTVRVNGEPVENGRAAVNFDDRGLQYGDGLFETLLWVDGRIRFLDDHLQRLAAGCARLNIPVPPQAVVASELEGLAKDLPRAVLKLIVTRGAGGRGYRPPARLQPTRIVSVHAAPDEPLPGVERKIRWCTTRLARTAALAGLKHLNRLEQVLAQMEPASPEVAEGLMLDTEGELIGGISSNVFLLIEGGLVTPDLRYSGIQGVMRKNVLAAAGRIGIPVEVRAVRPEELALAAEVFLTNAVRGIQPVHALEELRWPTGPVTTALLREPALNGA